MRILFLSSLMTEADFGGRIHQIELVSNLSKKEDIYVIPSSGGKAILIEDGKELPIVGEYSKYNHLRYMFRILWHGMKSQRHQRCDVIYARHGISTLPALFLGKLSSTPVIIEVNGILADEYKLSRNKDVYHHLLNRLDTIAFTKFHTIVVVTDGLKEHITKNHTQIHANQIIVIHNGVNSELFRPKIVTEARSKLHLHQEKKYICFVGSLAPWQGVEHVIKAIPEIKMKIHNAHFLIVGDGPERSRLEHMTEQMVLGTDITFTGNVPYRDVPDYINASDVCVSPKKPLKSGYSPLKLYEYMACGKPMVVSRNKGLDIVEKIKSGILFEPDNPEDLANSIIWILSHESEAIKMGKRGREYVEKERSWEIVANKVLELCREVSGTHPE